MKRIFILVPEQYIGLTLRPAGWCKVPVIAGYNPEDVSDLVRFVQSVIDWSPEVRRIVVEVTGESRKRFNPRMTGPDEAYHGVWCIYDTIPTKNYSVLGEAHDVYNM